MIPKMQILNRREYQEKFDLALAYFSNGNNQQALNLLLELKNKRWVKFELFFLLAKVYYNLNQYKEAEKYLSLANPNNDEEIQQKIEFLISIPESKKLQDEQNITIFAETESLKTFVKYQDYFAQAIERESIQYSDIQIFLTINYYLGLFHTCAINMRQFLEEKQSFIQQNYNKNQDQGLLQEYIIFILITSENYQESLNKLDNFQINEYQKIYLQAFCYLQLKQYRRSLKLYQQLTKKLKNSSYTYADFIIYLTEGKQGIIDNTYYVSPIPHNMFISYNCIAKYLNQNNTTQYEIISIKQAIAQFQNSHIYLYYNLFLYQYQMDKLNPTLQKICDHMLKYSPRYAGGYACQYVLLIDQMKIQQIETLLEPLKLCDDSSLKYITIAQIYKTQNKFELAHKALDEAIKINKYEEDIYLLRTELYILQNKYQQAHQTKRELVQLEQENFVFVNSIIAPLINKYQYYRAIELLELTDKESNLLNQLKVLIKILSLMDGIVDDQLQNEFIKINENVQILFQGHICLIQNNFQQALDQYQTYLEVLDYQYQYQYQQIQQGIQSIQMLQQDKVHKYQINDIICQMSLLNYKYIPDNLNLFIRYIDTIAFILTSLVFNDNLNQNCQYLNTHYDMEVPIIQNLKEFVLQNISSIYRMDYIKLDTFFGYVESSLKQLQRLFHSPEEFIHSFYKFCQRYEQDITTLLIERDHKTYKRDKEIKKLYELPFFYDPLSRYALFRVIKMIGYFSDNEQVNIYEKMEEWMQFYLLASHIDEYFMVVLKNKVNQ